MLIKRYSEESKTADIIRRLNVLHVDQSAISRSTLSKFLSIYDFIINRCVSVIRPTDILSEIQRDNIDCIWINYESCPYDFCLLLRKIKKLYPKTIVVIYNFSHSTFEKKHLLKAGVNALLPVHFKIEELLFAMQEISSDSVYLNDLVDSQLLLNVKANIIDGVEGLTTQQVIFIRNACNGLSHKEIGEKCFNSKQRVHNVFHQIRMKTGCESPIDLLRLALMYRIIDWSENLFAKES